MIFISTAGSYTSYDKSSIFSDSHKIVINNSICFGEVTVCFSHHDLEISSIHVKRVFPSVKTRYDEYASIRSTKCGLHSNACISPQINNMSVNKKHFNEFIFYLLSPIKIIRNYFLPILYVIYISSYI